MDRCVRLRLRAGRTESVGWSSTAAGQFQLCEAHSGALAYSYLFDGQLGYLDHALA